MSCGQEINILGAIFINLSTPSQPNRPVVRMFYIAEDVDQIILSLDSLQALGVVSQEFPNITAPVTVSGVNTE